MSLRNQETFGCIAGQIHDVMVNQCDSDCHKKVYDDEGTIGMTLRWICSVCGVRGSDPLQRKLTEYDKLVKKFHGGDNE